MSDRWSVYREQAKANRSGRDRSCLRCGRDAWPRFAYCSDECSRLHREELAGRRSS